MNYNYSYSGADCDVYAVQRISTYTGSQPTGSAQAIIHLDNIATVSVSMYEAKAPVRRLGHASPVGFTGNIRSIAGSLIFIVKNEHPLGIVMRRFGQLHKHLDDDVTQKGFSLAEVTEFNPSVFNAGMIRPFDLMLMYKNEVDARGAGLRINNLEFISEGIVTSVNDIVSEVVLQFVATDIDQLELERVRQPKVAEKTEAKPFKPASRRLAGFTISVERTTGVAEYNEATGEVEYPKRTIVETVKIRMKIFVDKIGLMNYRISIANAEEQEAPQLDSNIDFYSKNEFDTHSGSKAFRQVLEYYLLDQVIYAWGDPDEVDLDTLKITGYIFDGDAGN